MIAVEKKKKMPKHHLSKYPWADLKVGDSFLIEGKKNYSIYSCLNNYNSTAKPKIKITQRQEENGIRVWRIK